MIDLGDVNVLSVNITDSTGAPANVGAMTLTVTKPDGTTTVVSGGSLTNSPTGTYSYAYPTVLSGRHEVNWAATGANACVYNDSFWVAGADPNMVIGLAEARASIGLGAADTINDADLRTIIAGATPILEDLVGPILPRTVIELHDGGHWSVMLDYPPVISVTTVIEAYGSTYERTLTLQNIFNGSAVDAYGYDYGWEGGLLVRRVSGVHAPFPPGRRNVQVTYMAGRFGAVGLPPLPVNIYNAARRLIRHLAQSEKFGLRQAGGAPEQMVLTPGGYAVPRAVVEMVADQQRAPGIA